MSKSQHDKTIWLFAAAPSVGYGLGFAIVGIVKLVGWVA